MKMHDDELDIDAALVRGLLEEQFPRISPSSRPIWPASSRRCGRSIRRLARSPVGDPACDVMVAWKILSMDARGKFRAALAVDDVTWSRARGWVLSQALIALPYYTMETNPTLVLEARRWMEAVLTC